MALAGVEKKFRDGTQRGIAATRVVEPRRWLGLVRVRWGG